MQVRQIQVANDSVQDRLILRIGTQANEEIRVFLTRRFLRELWPHLKSALAAQATPTPLPTSEEPRAEEPSFDQPFRDDNPTYPLGANPLLASEASLTTAGDGHAQLSFREGRERSFNLNLNTELLQAFCAMLRAASEQAQWDLALDYAPTPSHPDHPSDKPIILH